jgi:thiamine-phosphate pyrophosphorylase
VRLPRFYPIVDTGELARADLAPKVFAEALLAAGVRLAQFRHKGPLTRQAWQQAAEVGRAFEQGGIAYIINDRADLALMLRAEGISVAGVHVGQDDLPPAEVRKLIGPELWLGFSTHNEQQLRAGDREAVDYLALGPLFGTATKEKPDPTVGVEEFARLRRLTKKPLVAIGGITRSRARQALDAGADSLAVISDVIAEDLPTRLAEWISVTAAP